MGSGQSVDCLRIGVGGSLSRCFQAGLGGLRHHRAPRCERARCFSHFPEGKVCSSGCHETWILPCHQIVRIAIPGIGGGQVKHQVATIGRWRELEAEFLTVCERNNRHLPSLGAIAFADMANRGEPPQRLLPRGNDAGNSSGIGWAGFLPAGAHLIENQRWLFGCQCFPKSTQIFSVEIALGGHLRDRLRAGFQFLALGKRGCKVGLERQPAPGIGVELNALQIHRCTAHSGGVFGVECADSGELFFGPVSLRHVGRKGHSIGQQHCMTGNIFSCIEVFSQQRWRHGHGVAGIGEALSGSVIGRKLAHRVEWNPCQIANSVGVFGIVEAPQNHLPGVASRSARHGIQTNGYRFAERKQVCFCRLLRLLRRHFSRIDGLSHLAPQPGVPASRVGRQQRFEAQFAFFFRLGVASKAISLQKTSVGRLS